MTIFLLLVVALSCWLVGYGIGRRRARKQLAARALQREPLTCDCGHLYTSHKVTKPYRCTAALKTGSSLPCACQRYVGPVPAPTLAELRPEAPKVGE